jgi:hypothetical protein
VRQASFASGPLVIGFDPAWMGGDRHARAWRRGRRVIKVESRVKLDTMQAAGWLKQVIDADKRLLRLLGLCAARAVLTCEQILVTRPTS